MTRKHTEIFSRMLLAVLMLSMAGCPSAPTTKKERISGFFQLARATTNRAECPTCNRLEIVDTAGESKSYFQDPEAAFRIDASDIEQLDLVSNDAPWHTMKLWSGALVLTASAKERLRNFAATEPGDFLLTAGSDLAIEFFDRRKLLSSDGILIFTIPRADVRAEFERRIGPHVEWYSDAGVDREEMCKSAAKGDSALLASCLEMTDRESVERGEAQFREFEHDVDRSISEGSPP